jgi:hypothetical protein
MATAAFGTQHNSFPFPRRLTQGERRTREGVLSWREKPIFTPDGHVSLRFRIVTLTAQPWSFAGKAIGEDDVSLINRRYPHVRKPEPAKGR